MLLTHIRYVTKNTYSNSLASGEGLAGLLLAKVACWLSGDRTCGTIGELSVIGEDAEAGSTAAKEAPPWAGMAGLARTGWGTMAGDAAKTSSSSSNGLPTGVGAFEKEEREVEGNIPVPLLLEML